MANHLIISASRAGSSCYCSALIAELLGSDQQRVKPTRASFARQPSRVVAQDAVAQNHARRREGGGEMVLQNLLCDRGPKILLSGELEITAVCYELN